jgi:hypothetical protein
VLEETQETEEIIQRVAALDVGKAELTCCVRVPGPGSSGRRLQEVRTYQTMTRWLLVMADRLVELGVTRVVMEATSWPRPSPGLAARPWPSTPPATPISGGCPRPSCGSSGTGCAASSTRPPATAVGNWPGP